MSDTCASDVLCVKFHHDTLHVMVLQDYGCVTLLLPGDEGLQVYYKDAWYPVPLIKDAFVINFGDLLQVR